MNTQPTWANASVRQRKAARTEIKRSIDLHESRLKEADSLGLKAKHIAAYEDILDRFRILYDLAGEHLDDPTLPAAKTSAKGKAGRRKR